MILSLVDAANAPPALVVNENVATLEVLAATRSVDSMVNVVLVTLSPIWPDAICADAKSRVVDTVMPLVVAACGVPVVNVPMPTDRVMTEAVVAAVATTTVMLPNAAVEPEAGVFVTATSPTATPAHAVAQEIELVPAAAAAARVVK